MQASFWSDKKLGVGKTIGPRRLFRQPVETGELLPPDRSADRYPRESGEAVLCQPGLNIHARCPMSGVLAGCEFHFLRQQKKFPADLAVLAARTIVSLV